MKSHSFQLLPELGHPQALFRGPLRRPSPFLLISAASQAALSITSDCAVASCAALPLLQFISSPPVWPVTAAPIVRR